MRTLYTTAFFTCLTSLALAQCMPDLGNSAPGVYPEILNDGCVNANYSQQLDLVFQADTVISSPFGPLTVPFDSIRINVSGLPTGLSHECPSTTCTVTTVSGQLPRTCMLINGLPSAATVANNTFNLDIEYWVTIFGMPQPLTEVKTVGLTINSEVNVAVVNSNSVLTAQSGSGTFQWVDCDNGSSIIEGETSASFAPTVSGNYAVAVTVGECVALSECVFVGSVGISDPDPLDFQIFPTPAHEQITLAIPGLKGTFALHLIDAAGRVVYQAAINATQTTIDISALDKGVYLIRLSQNGVSSVQKLMVN